MKFNRALNRRHFLMTTMIGAASASSGAGAPDPLPEATPDSPTGAELPEGVIAPYRWEDDPIPVSGSGLPAMDAIDGAVTAAMREYGVAGCGVCITRGDEIVYSKGFGFAELPDTPFRPSTTSRCGSLAKPVTALAVLLLADDGKLHLDEEILPILRTIDIVPRPVEAGQMDDRIARITVRHLMDHASGLPGWATYTAWRMGRNVIARQKLTRTATGADVAADALGNTRLSSEPGERFEYANANFVLLARVVEAKGGKPFNDYLTRDALPRFGVKRGEIHVSRNQIRAKSRDRGRNEAAYYQTSEERYVSFLPADQSKGRVFGEAYRGYATEASDGAGGIACAAPGLGRIVARLHSDKPGLSPKSFSEIITPPSLYASDPGFDPASSNYYSKGFNVRFSGGRPWFSHGGMTNHCGGVIGHNAGYQWAVVSNWNHAHSPYVDWILDRALAEAVTRLNG